MTDDPKAAAKMQELIAELESWGDRVPEECAGAIPDLIAYIRTIEKEHREMREIVERAPYRMTVGERDVFKDDASRVFNSLTLNP